MPVLPKGNAGTEMPKTDPGTYQERGGCIICASAFHKKLKR
jgi:hypothetical protein